MFQDKRLGMHCSVSIMRLEFDMIEEHCITVQKKNLNLSSCLWALANVLQVYTGCDEAYRLTLSGNINVPPEATDLFCTGPCLTQTQAILNCIDNVLSDFLFYNRATVRDIRYVLRAGCSHTNLRGIALSLLLMLFSLPLFVSLEFPNC